MNVIEKNNIQIAIPERAGRIIRRLEQAGFEAFVVGGCVRDACLGRVPHDWDITTNASPAQVKALFRKTVDTGIAHGTVTVLQNGEGFEVTTYRVDGLYEDGRHPKEVTFTGSLREDLLRRDFTINAMAYSDRTGLVDVFGGLKDLKGGCIRCVGKAEERFSEDALRILRAVRFAAQLSFEIEPETKAAARTLAENLRKISAERIREELQKTIMSDHPEMLRTAWELGITAVVLPELDKAMEGEIGEHALRAMGKIRPEPVLRWTMLLHDLGKPDEVLFRLKSDRQTQRMVHALSAAHSEHPAAEPAAVRRLASALGRETFSLWLEVKQADIQAGPEKYMDEELAWLKEIRTVWEGICERQDPLTLGELAVTGGDLIREGMKPGRQMGAVLQALLQAVLEEPQCNNRERLLELADESIRLI